jgi:hypothetical protein
MWKVLSEVSIPSAFGLLTGRLVAFKSVPLWLVIWAFAVGTIALAMWVHDAGHLPYPARWIDAHRQRKADADAAFLAGVVERIRALAEERTGQEEGAARDLWHAVHNVESIHPGNLWTVGVMADPPKSGNPFERPMAVGSCIVRHGETEYESGELSSRAVFGLKCGFPQGFSPELTLPLLPGRYEIEWRIVDALCTRDTFVIDEQGNIRR